MQRNTVFDYQSLSLPGKLSLWLGNRRIVSNLQKGTWLDLLSSHTAPLQRAQQGHSPVTAFYALDHKLDPQLTTLGFHCTEAHLEKTLPYEDNFFENITMVNGLEHLWHPQEILAECFRVLKPGGCLQIIVPSWVGKPILEFFAFTIKNKQAFIEMNDHKMYYDKKTLWPMLVKAGFQPKNLHQKRIKFCCSLLTCAN